MCRALLTFDLLFASLNSPASATMLNVYFDAAALYTDKTFSVLEGGSLLAGNLLIDSNCQYRTGSVGTTTGSLTMRH